MCMHLSDLRDSPHFIQDLYTSEKENSHCLLDLNDDIWAADCTPPFVILTVLGHQKILSLITMVVKFFYPAGYVGLHWLSLLPVIYQWENHIMWQTIYWMNLYPSSKIKLSTEGLYIYYCNIWYGTFCRCFYNERNQNWYYKLPLLRFPSQQKCRTKFVSKWQ